MCRRESQQESNFSLHRLIHRNLCEYSVDSIIYNLISE
jgi:hypothetical protein